MAAYLIMIAGVLDFFDGFAARALKVTGPLGQQLDSLADMVTFGVVPGMIMFQLFKTSDFISFPMSSTLIQIGKTSMLLIPIFSCLRLANFNIDTRQTTYFIGVPTPANTLMIISLPYIIEYNSLGLASILKNPWVLILIAGITSWLLVAEIPLISLKIKKLNWKHSKAQILLALGSITLILVFNYAAPLAIFIFYVLLSLLIPPNKNLTS
jgi:CDP-diacylglycerol--serine O-phosphatidyltransferase